MCVCVCDVLLSQPRTYGFYCTFLISVRNFSFLNTTLDILIVYHSGLTLDLQQENSLTNGSTSDSNSSHLKRDSSD